MAAPQHMTILPIPGMGHLIPLLQLAKRLVTLHSVHATFLLYPNESQSTFLASTTFPSTVRFIHLPPVSTPFSDTDILHNLTLAIRESSPAIESAILSESRQTILLVDMFATAALEIARKLSIPFYIFFSSTAALLSFMIYLPVLDRQVDGEFVDLPEPIKIPGCHPIRPEDVVALVPNRKDSIYHSFLYNASRFCSADGILVNTCQELEPVALKALESDPVFQQLGTPCVYPVGPLVKTKESAPGNECLEWLDNQPPDSVLFISFGSHWYLSGEQISELAWGLELSGHRFIWVLKKATTAEDDTGQDNDLSDPINYLPDGFLNRINQVGMVVTSWVPQVEILSHASTGGFLSHCGWNSMLESITNGVPMITWPLFAEQKMNATMLVNELGLAVRLEVMKREETEKVVRLVMDGEQGKRLKGRAKELKEIVLRGLDEGGDSSNKLSQVVKKWKAHYTVFDD